MPDSPEKQTYTVQQRISEAPHEPARWEDVATVDVPPRTRRSNIIRIAFNGEEPDESIDVRVLDADSAKIKRIRPRRDIALDIEDVDG